MTSDQVELIAIILHELDRQRGLRAWRWEVGHERKRELYRARSRELLAGERFAKVKRQLEERYRHVGRAIASMMDELPYGVQH